MNMPHRKQSQFELFPGSAAQAPEMANPRYPFSAMTISAENMIVVCIVLLMVFVLFFSLGVERGKRVGVVTVPKKIIAVQNKTSDIIAPQLTTAQPVPGHQMPVPVVPTGRQVLTPNVTPKLNEVPIVEPSPAEGSFTVQVASFKLQKNAQEEAEHLKKTGHEAWVIQKGSHYIVCVGRFVEKTLAQKFTTQIRGRYKDYLVRRL